MADDDRRPDHTEDPRKQEQGSEGYPETTPSGSDPEADPKPAGDAPDADE